MKDCREKSGYPLWNKLWGWPCRRSGVAMLTLKNVKRVLQIVAIVAAVGLVLIEKLEKA
jgi:hypothetical protein